MPRRITARASLTTVAAELGVSTATVSNVYNRPEKVSPELRRRVLAAAERQGYAGPDPAARQLSRGRTDTLGLLFTGELSYAFKDPAAVAFLEGLSSSCQTAELNLLIISAESTSHRSGAVGNAIVDGFVVYAVGDDDPHFRQIIDRQLPTVVVDSPRHTPGVDWVGPDDRAGARALGEVLVRMGHRRIGAIAAGTGGQSFSGPADDVAFGPAAASVFQDRARGLRDALAVVGVTDLPVELRPANTVADGVSACHALLDRRPDLTAVCALMDVMALGALEAAAARGLSVPGDLTVTGYDDIPRAAAIGLTTVSQPLVDKGRIAGELYLSHRRGAAPRRRVLPTHVQLRASSGPARA
ncbi:LacI family DNA-binding transcriptional regulator [Nakamurella deserti]|uniref:LacI family DNA-binding transcriptional regulator n=1 Tax=Nakamurella deserti TaxID=2164074 RepID=UPI000DBE92B7|nr:LacI family DNA-binding transcriptional regulator [Nakamurella deserti]